MLFYSSAYKAAHWNPILKSSFTNKLTIPYWPPHLIDTTSYTLADREKGEDGTRKKEKWEKHWANSQECFFFFPKYTGVSVVRGHMMPQNAEREMTNHLRRVWEVGHSEKLLCQGRFPQPILRLLQF